MTIAIVEFLGLLLYEVLCAFLLGAFSEMKPQRKTTYLLVALLPLALMTMFHSENIGNDTGEYIKFFWQCKYTAWQNLFTSTRFESGYALFVSVCSYLFDSAQSILVAEGLFVYIALGRWLKKWCKAPGMFCIFLVAALQFDGWMSMQRQALAVAVLFWAFDALVEKKWIQFIVITLLAAQFHNAAYVFLLAYPAVYFLNSSKEQNHNLLRFNILAIVGCIGTMIAYHFLLAMLLSHFATYQYYANGAYMDGETRLAIILQIAVYGLLLLVPYILTRTIYIKDRFLQLLYKLSIINLGFVILASQATVLTRLAGVYSLYAFLLYTECVSRMKYRGNRLIVLTVTIALFAIYGAVITVYRTPSWQTTYPFEWCF